MKVFAFVLVAAVLLQVAVAAPRKSCGCAASKPAKAAKPACEESLEDEAAGWADMSEEAPARPTKSQKWAAESAEEQDDDCTVVSKPQVVQTTGSRCEQNEKIYLHRQAPIYVRPPPSRIFINHPPVVVRQPPVILHHQSRTPVLIKPILIKEREVAASPVQFKISKADSGVSVSPCENPKVHVSTGSSSGYSTGSSSGSSGCSSCGARPSSTGCGCQKPRKEKCSC